MFIIIDLFKDAFSTVKVICGVECDDFIMNWEERRIWRP